MREAETAGLMRTLARQVRARTKPSAGTCHIAWYNSKFRRE
jgi:hypothetical protein